MELCFATNNTHKLEEVRAATAGNINILSLSDIRCFEELPETQPTLEGNSLQKAEYVNHHYHIPCFADDTGLEVEALHGAPGVFSARYAGPQRNSGDNISLLLDNLRGITNRNARFRTVISLVGLGSTQLFDGIVTGTIRESSRGTQGFGYDPVFQPTGFQQTFAEMTLEQKNTLSHRAIAVAKLVRFLLKN
ncbi:MAG: RdgB/HAM1 family non-canonical purine NTP pyrophosphatase [Bacteroidia bacterium]|nr:RdgB/HAM1 family non-canonical purine NTP pyrophosphatase [Bacteroidia bacterium]